MLAIPKLFESFLLPNLYTSFSNYIVPERFGFHPNMSTTTNLVSYYNYLINAVESGDQVDAIYTDISKAFDSVNHAVLTRKFELMGVNVTF